ncbi:hypothetical protein VCHC52A1_3196, partial [Vibrio cholerae HC-52A1]
MQQGKVLI